MKKLHLAHRRGCAGGYWEFAYGTDCREGSKESNKEIEKEVVENDKSEEEESPKDESGDNDFIFLNWE